MVPHCRCAPLRRRLQFERLEDRTTPSTIQFSSGFYSVSEATPQATITVVRQGDVSNAETVNYVTSDGTAHAGDRYATSSGTLNFGSGQPSASFTVGIFNSPFVNYNQSLNLTLSGPTGGASLGAQATAKLLIIDDQGTAPLAFLQGQNQVFPTGLGINDLQYAPDGTLEQLLWVRSAPELETWNLVFLRRNALGNWAPETLLTNQSIGLFSLPPSSTLEQFAGLVEDAQLLIDSNNLPHVLVYEQVGSQSQLIHFRRDGSGWTQLETVPLPSSPANNFNVCTNMVAAIGTDNFLHVAFTEHLNSQLNGASFLYYGTNRGGAWNITGVAALGNQLSGIAAAGVRDLSLAVDSQGFAHIAYTPAFQDNSPPGSFYGRPYSVLAYATNAGGSWGTQVVFQPLGDAGDAGLGASIALNPSGVATIASYFTTRAETGSAQAGELLYHVQQPNGAWATSVVATQSAGYALSDGPQFTGFAPLLRYDGAGNPEIVFTDHAAQHAPSPINGAPVQSEYSGQLRQAVFVNGAWNFATVIPQNLPTIEELVYPTFALSPAGAAYGGLIQISNSVPSVVSAQIQYGLVANDVGARLAGRFGIIASDITHSAENFASIVTAAYQQYLHRNTDPGGVAYWVGRLQSGLADEQLEANLLASPEYIAANGGVNGQAGQGWVVGMYRDLLGRTADPGGLSYWTNQIAAGTSPFSIAIGFAASQERESTRINSDYQQFLDRQVDPGGLNFWLAQFVQGTARNEDLVAGFIGSEEYFFNHGRGTVPTWIQSLYADVLHRAPSSQELQNWIAFATA
jgi:hypothetical protein